MKTPIIGGLLIILSGLTLAFFRPDENVVVKPPENLPDDGTLDVRLVLDREVLQADAPGNAILKVTLDPREVAVDFNRPPVNLAIVIDRSGSMGGEKIAHARHAAMEAVRRLGKRDIFSLVTYGDRAVTVIPAGSDLSEAEIERRIYAIESGGSTALYAGVTRAAAEIRTRADGYYVNRILLISDGLANAGPSSPEELGRLGTTLAQESITVSTVGLGLGYNEDLMTRLARAGEGNTFFVTSADDLSRIFKIELGDVGNVVARKIGVDIRFPEGVRPIRILGREGRVARDRVFLEFTQVYGHMPKHALIEVAIDPGSSDASREIAVAEVNYRCGVDNEFRQVVARVNARFSASKSVVQNSANIEVMRDLAESLIAVAKDEVVEMMDRGEKTAAVSRLGALKEEIDGWNAQLRDEKLEEQSAVLAQEAAELEIHGMDNAKRKAYRTESYQSSNSQYAY